MTDYPVYFKKISEYIEELKNQLEGYKSFSSKLSQENYDLEKKIKELEQAAIDLCEEQLQQESDVGNQLILAERKIKRLEQELKGVKND